jgi:hypothetical protein
MNEPAAHSACDRAGFTREIWVRLAVSILGLCAGIAALIVAILLLRGVL